jgi:hypothetical protein
LRQRPGDRNLPHWILGEGDAQGVPDAVLQERSDADGALDARVLAVPGFRHPQVEGLAGLRGARGEPRRQQSVGLDGHLGIARLHAEDDVVESLLLAAGQELDGTLHHAKGGVAVAVHDPVGEGAVVGADAQGPAQLLAAPRQGSEALGHALQLVCILGVRVLAHRELLLVGIVAGIDPHLLHVLGGHQGSVGREVDVGHQRDPHAPAAQLVLDLRQMLRVLNGRRRHAHDLAAGIHQPLDLVAGGPGVARVGGGHGLDADRIGTTDAHVSDANLAGGPAP